MKNTYKRNNLGFSLIETMTVITVLAIVISLLYAYSEEGWRLFYQSSSRGLTQVKAKLAIRILQEDLREANKARLNIDQGISYGVPLPDDVKENTLHVYFTKPKFFEATGDVIGYDYVLYYFARPKKKLDQVKIIRKKDDEEFLILKSIKFINQSKHYTEDKDKTWPFLPPILELNKSTLPEDKSYIEALKSGLSTNTTEFFEEGKSEENKDTQEDKEEELFDHFAKLKKVKRNIPISSNFLATSLTEPFSKEEISILFGQDYSVEEPIKIKVSLQESPFFFGVMASMTEFEVTITPRN